MNQSRGTPASAWRCEDPDRLRVHGQGRGWLDKKLSFLDPDNFCNPMKSRKVRFSRGPKTLQAPKSSPEGGEPCQVAPLFLVWGVWGSLFVVMSWTLLEFLKLLELGESWGLSFRDLTTLAQPGQKPWFCVLQLKTAWRDSVQRLASTNNRTCFLPVVLHNCTFQVSATTAYLNSHLKFLLRVPYHKSNQNP